MPATDRSSFAALFVHRDAPCGHRLPPGVGHAVEHRRADLRHGLDDARDVANAGLTDGCVVAGQVVFALEADAVGEADVVVVRALLQLAQLVVEK